MDPLPRLHADSGYPLGTGSEETGTTSYRSEEHLFPTPGPLPEFEGGLVTAEELRVLLEHDDQN